MMHRDVSQRGKVERFASAHPVFTRNEFRNQLFPEQPKGSADSLLRYHTAVGRFRHVAPGVYAVVPAHLDGSRFQADRYLATSMMRPDGVIAYHAALDLHGLAYSEVAEFQVLSGGRPGLVSTSLGPVRFVSQPAALVRNGAEMSGVVELDRRGLNLRATGLERTLVDCLDRPDLAGGLEELAHALWIVGPFDVPMFVDMIVRRDKDALAAVAGWWIESRAEALGVEAEQISRLRSHLPSTMRRGLPGLGDVPSRPAEDWMVEIPDELAQPAFEGLSGEPMF